MNDVPAGGRLIGGLGLHSGSPGFAAEDSRAWEVPVSQVRVFVSFDLDHDNDCKDRLVRQLAPEGSNFTVNDWSIREIAADWQEKARKRIANTDLLLLICGEHTDTAASVNNEIEIARETNKPYLLLDGRSGRGKRPKTALETDRILDWNVNSLWSPAASSRRATVR
jgi:hypothetical protein